MSMAWCVAGQGVVCNTVTLVNFHRSLWVMRSRCRMVRAVNPVLALQATIGRAVTALVCYKYRRMCIVEMASVVVRVHCK